MKILIFRSGAYGDVLISTPLVRYLASQGHELTYVTSKRGMEILKGNPHIKNLIQHKEETPLDKLAEQIEYLQKKYKCERVIDLSESIEVALSLHPRGTHYTLPKQEKLKRFNRNFYEYTFEHCNESWEGQSLVPELFFDDKEIQEAGNYLKEGCYNILLGLAGSGNNKAWPYGQDFTYKLIDTYPDVHIITTGDEKCRLIEPEREGRITNLCGKASMRTSMALTGLVDLVIAPDTGIIHAAGCYDTPKICLLGHNTIECITKHFVNDYSIEADQEKAPCAPCLFLIYNMKLQCPLSLKTGGSICMSEGMSLERVFKRFQEVYDATA